MPILKKTVFHSRFQSQGDFEYYLGLYVGLVRDDYLGSIVTFR